METERVEIQAIPEIKDVITACSDLHGACTETGTRYLVIGSVAAVCAVGELYRVPADVDGWYDTANAIVLREAFKKRGYDHKIIETSSSLFPNPLERFEKGDSVIDLRGADYTERGIEYQMRLPVPRIPVEKRPVGSLIYTRTLAEPMASNFGGATVMTASREALWVGLSTTLPFVQIVDDKVDKRTLDLEKLSERLDQELIKKMLDEKPGLYFGKKPLVTTNNRGLLDFLALVNKLKNRLK